MDETISRCKARAGALADAVEVGDHHVVRLT